LKKKVALAVGGTLAAAVLAWCAWLFFDKSGAHQLLVRLSTDEAFLKQTVEGLGILAPLIFISFQALQVIISPIPGEPVGILGGYLFGPWGGFFYSMIGLTLGSLACFAIGRWLGVHFVRKLVNARAWQRIGFIVEAEGAIICAVVFAIPGLPKDITCYLFGVSTIPFWVFAVVSTIARAPHTWVLSKQGAQAASGDYLELVLLTAAVLLVVLPAYYYRSRLMDWLRARGVRGPGGRVESGSDTRRPS
jgi:uncharacterized membrane protein YdjX (TVP38/TMEM64 family)